MGIVSRMLKRLGPSCASRRTVRPGTRSLAIEPLEDRRLLAAHPAAPDGFNVFHVKDPSGNYTQLLFKWEDTNSGETGYEIERSITGYDDTEHPNLWGGGFGSNLAGDDNDMTYKASYRRYYFRIRSTGHPGSPSNSDWSAPIVALPKPPEDPNAPDPDIVLPEDKTVKVSAIAHSQIDVPLILAKIEL